MTSQSKSLIEYFDIDANVVRKREFSGLEQSRMKQIFDIVDGILSDFHKEIMEPGEPNKVVGYWPSIGSCECGSGKVIFYDVRLRNPALSIDEINQMDTALDKIDVLFINVNADFEQRKLSLYLMDDVNMHRHKKQTEMK